MDPREGRCALRFRWLTLGPDDPEKLTVRVQVNELEISNSQPDPGRSGAEGRRRCPGTTLDLPPGCRTLHLWGGGEVSPACPPSLRAQAPLDPPSGWTEVVLVPRSHAGPARRIPLRPSFWCPSLHRWVPLSASGPTGSALRSAAHGLRI